ncbi:MAG: PBP1A family penicillin-binding protein [Myxococcota bacterium]
MAPPTRKAPRADTTRRARPRRTPKRPKRRWGRRLLKLMLTLALLGAVALAGVFAWYGRDLPEVASLRDYAPPQTTRVLDRHGALLGEVFDERRTVVSMEAIPRNLVVSVLAAEDADFYRHEGLDYPGIMRALAYDVLEGRAAQGASTITQQVVKLLLLSPERTLARKIRELILARRLEQELSKDEILHLYLNHINFGHGRYGAQEAARYYFGKDARDLSLAEATLIAGVPQAPARLSPRTHPEAARRRQAFVIRQLLAKREAYWPDLSAEDIAAAGDAEVVLTDPPAPEARAPELLASVRRWLRDAVGDDAYARGGYTVHTTLDADLQSAARSALREGLERVDRRQRRRGPLRVPRRAPALEEPSPVRVGHSYRAQVVGTDDDERLLRFTLGGELEVLVDLDGEHRYDPEDLAASVFGPVGSVAKVIVDTLPDAEGDPARGHLDLGPQGAVVLIEPRTREVLALVGSYGGTPGFDRARQALRQPGSTFKPFVYALGLKRRELTAASVMIDAPAVYDEWRPQNYEPWAHEGSIPLRRALARSVNVVAIRAIEQLGPAAVVDFAGQLGIPGPLDASLALALGASEVSPLHMANAYATFAAGGRWAPPRYVTRVTAPDGSAVRWREPEPARDVLTPDEAFLVTDLLTSVVTDGTAQRARRLGRPVAGKTGTSNAARDAWFVGFTPEVAAAVWVGFDDRRSLGRRESGGRTALPIWIDAVGAATEGRPVVPFAEPSGLVRVRIDAASGLLAYEGQEDAVDEIFLAGTEPTESARPPDVADAATFLIEQLGEAAPPRPVTPEPAP